MEIPAKYQCFCKDIAKLAIEYDLNKFNIHFSPGFEDWREGIWNSEIQCSWNSGRHGDSVKKLNISSTILIHTEIDNEK